MNEIPQKPPHPFPRSVEALEETLKHAYAGNVAAFAILTVDPKGIIGWKFHFGARAQTDLIGGLECMGWAILNSAMNPQPLDSTINRQEPPTETRQ